MEAVYQCSSIYTKSEHLKFEQYAYRHSGRMKKVFLYCLIMLAVAAGLAVLLAVTDRLALKTLWLPLLWVVGAVIYGAANGSMGRELSWKMSPGVHDAHQHYFFYTDHIKYVIGENAVTVPYEAIHAIGETEGNIYIMLNARQGMSIRKSNAPAELPGFLREKYKEYHAE